MTSSPTFTSNNSRPTRSISLLFESNPVVLRVTRELNEIRKWEESSTSTTESFKIGLCGVADLYKCINNVLTLPITQQALSLHQHRPSVDELVKGSEKLGQLCASTRDLASQLKEASSNLRSSLFQDTHHAQLSVSIFVYSRRNIAKGAKYLLSSLKKIESENFSSSKTLNHGDDEVHRRLSVVMNMLRCVGIISIYILESFLMFLATPVSVPITKSKRSGLVSRLMKRDDEAAKSKLNHQEEDAKNGSNKLTNIYVSLCVLMSPNTDEVLIEEEKVRLVCKTLESLEVGIEGIENGLDSVSRRLVLNRASLLEILSL